MKYLTLLSYNNQVIKIFKNFISCRIILALLLIWIGFLTGCGSRTVSSDDVEFTVNKNLISTDLFSEEGFQVAPPLGWKASRPDLQLSFNLPNQFSPELKAVYTSDSSDCILMISGLPETNTDLPPDLLTNPDKYFNRDSLWNVIQPSKFHYHTFDCFQFVLQNSETVLFKLILANTDLKYELDYIIPRNRISETVKSVESSIGSIQYIEP